MTDKTTGTTTANKPPAKRVADSRVRLIQLMGPEHANVQGNVHGGHIMKLVDEAGALASIKHAHSLVVTVVMDTMTFMEPIFVGNLVTLDAEVTYAGTTSMEVRVTVQSENPLTGQVSHTNYAYLVYVAIDAAGRPTPVPPLIAETEEEKVRMENARRRQQYRKQQREQETRPHQKL